MELAMAARIPVRVFLAVTAWRKIMIALPADTHFLFLILPKPLEARTFATTSFPKLLAKV